MVEKLRDYGTLVLGFSVTFPEPDRSVRDLFEPVDLSALDPSLNATPEDVEPLIDSDRYLHFANVMQSGSGVVLAINFNILKDAGYNDLPFSIGDVPSDLAEQLSLHDMPGYLDNIPILQEAALGNGNMNQLNQLPDAAGMVRSVPLLLRYGNGLYATLSLEMVCAYRFAESMH